MTANPARIARDFNLRALPYRPQWTLAASLVPTIKGGFLIAPEARELKRLEFKERYCVPNYKMHMRRGIVNGQRKSFRVLQEDPLERLSSYFENRNPNLANEFPNLSSTFAKKQLEIMAKNKANEEDAYVAALKEFGVTQDEVSMFKTHIYKPLLEKLKAHFLEQNSSLSENDPLLAKNFAMRQLSLMSKNMMTESVAYNVALKDFGITSTTMPQRPKQTQSSDDLEQKLRRKSQLTRLAQFKLYTQMKSDILKPV
jgi:hypothetical protein